MLMRPPLFYIRRNLMEIKQDFVGSNGRLAIQTNLDVTDVLKENENLRQGNQDKKGMKLAARVDMPSLMRWGNEDFGNPNIYMTNASKTDPAVAAKLAIRLNLSENRKMRIWEGRVSKTDILSKR